MKHVWPRFLSWAGPVAVALALTLAALRGEPLQAASGSGVENPHGSFKQECELCHSSADWRTLRLSARFDHARYGFPLEAAHASAACTSCHQSLDFTRAQTVCASCHTDPHRGEMGTECARCHGARSFTDRAPMIRAHEMTKFPLNGAHAVVECEGCHKPAAQGQMQFVGTPVECRSCHEKDYRATRQPDHAAQGFPMDCRGCHTAQVWTTATFDHSRTAFPLTGAHVTQECASCHTGGNFAAADPACSSCHTSQYQNATPDHAAAGFPASQCATCHNTSTFAGGAFDHGATRFALTGAHAATACLSCHADGVYHGKPTDCASCHELQYGSATPSHSGAGFSASQCATCHTTVTWSGGRFDHGTTAFALTGAHQSSTCNSCHSDNVFNGKPAQCETCHSLDYANATPNHAASGFPASLCTTCHNTVTFAGATFNHSNTSFALTGAHQAVSCNSCHSDGIFDGKPTHCYSCHQSDYSGAVVNHAAAGFQSSACTSCHNTTTWTSATFNHTTGTSFPLTGSHVARACNDCHSDNVFNNKPTNCYSCHAADYAGATPNHPAAGFSTASCANCHNTTTFTGAVFNHNTNTSFPLTGAHQAAACTSCHSDGVYNGKPTDCASCHMADYNGATPNHATSGFPASTCANCHTTTTWSGATFNHSTNTSFPLTGAHQTVTCNSCHSDGVYDGKPTTCQSCHMSDYSGAPINHTAAGFAASACATCHTTTTWANAPYNHSATSFPLTGAHVSATCVSCHSNGVFNNHAMDCASCHMADYNAATPNHATSGFPASTCANCHNTTTFTGATFNHSTNTSFPLTGAHQTVTCNSCHGDGVYDGKPTACYACHQSDYTGATLNHTAAGFASSACATCHTTTAWTGATYNHSLTSFPLTGAHTTATCVSCHSNGVFNNHAMDCYSCHTDDYAGATPNHVTSGFAASSCATCHTTTTWAGATFNHTTNTSFPLTGAHQAVSCNSCHGDGVYDGKSTACYSCHQSDYTAAVPTHNATSFPTAACGSCHTTTAWAGATFNHSTTSFPLTGAHTTTTCNSCHSDGVYDGKPTACLSCHTPEWNSTTPSHAGAGFSAAQCATCHTTTAWTGGKYTAHDGAYFRIYSGKHNARWSNDCSSCHKSATTYSTFTCIACHEHSNKTEVDGHHGGQSGYTYTATSCYSCHRGV